MKFGRITKFGQHFSVVFQNNHAYRLQSEVAGEDKPIEAWLADPEALAEAGKAAIADGEAIEFTEDELLAPVKAPRKILAIALNFLDHARETGREPPERQTWFVKQVTALNAPYGTIDMPKVSDRLDYEAELVVVIGRGGRHIPAERADEVIAGYMCGNDVSVRDWQRATPTMIMGKGFDTHAPVGPWIVTPDEIGDANTLGVRTLLNGEVRQSGTTADLIHKIPDMIAHLSAAFTLEPGDLIFTGTPAGVAVAYDPPKFMKTGDRVRVEIDRIGHIEHVIADEAGLTRIG